VFHTLLTSFFEQTGCPVLVNTSFNVRGEPIVCTPEDAFRCFMRTEMDYLALGNFVLDKRKQAPLEKDDSWKEEFALD
jgi:carbamoyltransferase